MSKEKIEKFLNILLKVYWTRYVLLQIKESTITKGKQPTWPIDGI